MATKLFKIGEYSYYGKWRLTIKDDVINVKGIDWDSGVTMAERNFSAKDGSSLNPMDSRTLPEYLTEISTVYWGDTMMEWVKSKCAYKEPSLFGMGW